MRRYVKSEHCTSLSLTSPVPCAGTALQGEGQCQLLEHARSALPIIPQHKQSLRRLEHAQRQQTEVLSQLSAQIAAKPDTAERLAQALRRLNRIRERRSANQQAAALASEIEQARASINDVTRRIHLLAQAARTKPMAPLMPSIADSY